MADIFPRDNHDQTQQQYDGIINHDHETVTGPMNVENQPIFVQKFIERPNQIYNVMVDVEKQLKKVNELTKIYKMKLPKKKPKKRKKIGRASFCLSLTYHLYLSPATSY